MDEIDVWSTNYEVALKHMSYKTPMRVRQQYFS